MSVYVPKAGSGTILCESSTLVVAGSVHSVVRTPSSETVGAAEAVAVPPIAVAASTRNGASSLSIRVIGQPPDRYGRLFFAARERPVATVGGRSRERMCGGRCVPDRAARAVRRRRRIGARGVLRGVRSDGARLPPAVRVGRRGGGCPAEGDARRVGCAPPLRPVAEPRGV